MKKATRAFLRVRADASKGVVREKRWTRVARKGKSAISRGHRETVCRSEERNTIGGDIDLPWELPCATSWRSYARATSRFFFRDSNASRRCRRRRRRLVFPLHSPSFPIINRLREDTVFLYIIQEVPRLIRSFFIRSIALASPLFPSLPPTLQVSFDTHLREKKDNPVPEDW